MLTRRIHIVIGSLMMLFLGGSLTVSTLHSHHHIQWHHNGDFTDTGNCITADITICPICGYHMPTDPHGPDIFGNNFRAEVTVESTVELYPFKAFYLADSVRSPPLTA